MYIQRSNIDPIDFGGLKIFDFTANTKMSSSIAEIRVPPGGSHTVSWSVRSDKYYYVICGVLSFVEEGEKYELSPGDISIIKKGQKFSYSNNTDNDVKLLLVHTPSFRLDYEKFED